jgi:homocysteine S-methyltransferase
MNSRPLTILDGGLSTQLDAEGATFSGPLWTARALLETPELVERAHLAFVEAGAEIISTASYQISRSGFLEAGMSGEDADRALLESVLVAKRATAGTTTTVAASVGPWGATLHDGSEYRGNYGQSQAFLEDFHRERLLVLAEGKPDFFAIETIPEITEAKAVCEAAQSVPGIPFWVSFSCSTGTKLASGEPIRDAVLAIRDTPGLMALGVNCVPPENVESLLREISAVSDLPLIAYPNRGGIWDPDSGEWSGRHSAPLAHWAPGWQAAGVSLLGGCCGYGASDIRELSQSL